MKNRNKIIAIIAAISATLMLTGCGASTDATHTFENPTSTIVVEPATTIAATETTAVTEPIIAGYEIGDKVWCVRHANDLDEAAAIRYTLIDKTEDSVIVAPAYCGPDASFEELVEEVKSREENGEKATYTYPIEDCYADEEAAEAAANAENGEK